MSEDTLEVGAEENAPVEEHTGGEPVVETPEGVDEAEEQNKGR